MIISKSKETQKKNPYSFMDNLIFLFYTIYFILSPFYFWKSGIPQIADFIMVALILVYFSVNKLEISIYSGVKKFLLVGIFFVTYIVIINLIWSLFLQRVDELLLAIFYYVYNFLIVVFVISLFSVYREKIIVLTYKATLFSVLLQLVMLFVNGGFTGGRMAGSFNNPNQLGYYALLIASLLIFTSNLIKTKTLFLIIGLTSSMILVLVSLSKAAILSMLGLFMFFLITRSRNIRLKKQLRMTMLTVTVLLGIIYNTTTVIQNNQLYNSVQDRLNSIGQAEDDSLDGRGYYRITDYPEYWIFGAGEGHYSRFGNIVGEFHSTLGNVQVSYGLFGSLLFIIFILMALKNDRYQSWYILFFLMTYGLTHNGIRDSSFWILLALMAVNKSAFKEKLGNTLFR